MKKLVRVAHTPETGANFPELRRGATLINPRHVEEHLTRQEGEFFVIEEADLKLAIQLLTAENPGKEVQVYDLVAISICPAAEMITKQISKAGILPQS